MAFVSNEAIDAAADAIISTRELCGLSEAGSARDTLKEFGVTGEDADRAVRVAFARANRTWDRFRKEAGVPFKHRCRPALSF